MTKTGHSSAHRVMELVKALEEGDSKLLATASPEELDEAGRILERTNPILAAYFARSDKWKR